MKSGLPITIPATLLLAGCLHTIPPLPLDYPRAQLPTTRSLEESVMLLAWGSTNKDRQRRVEQRARELGMRPRTEPIDVYTRQDNVIVDLPGDSEDLIVLVAHYDKTDSNPFELVSLLLNGSLNRLTGLTVMSEGATDNATGVATVLQLGRWLAEQPTRRHSYRLVLAGAEEMGLRGSRAHVARMGSEDRDRLRLAINVDGVGIQGSGDCAIPGAGSEEVATWLQDAAATAGWPMGEATIPSFATSDHESYRAAGPGRDLLNSVAFNMVGVLLPQRSWFTTRHRAPVVMVSTCEFELGLGEVGSMFALPTGSMHGPRDKLSQVDPVQLHHSYRALQAFVEQLETGRYGDELRAIDMRMERTRRERREDEIASEG